MQDAEIKLWVGPKLGSALASPCPTSSTDQDLASDSQTLAIMDMTLDRDFSHHPGDQTGTC